MKFYACWRDGVWKLIRHKSKEGAFTKVFGSPPGPGDKVELLNSDDRLLAQAEYQRLCQQPPLVIEKQRARTADEKMLKREARALEADGTTRNGVPFKRVAWVCKICHATFDAIAYLRGTSWVCSVQLCPACKRRVPGRSMDLEPRG